MNQCKTCKKTGRVGCGYCGGDGKVSCETCGGSGHQLCWLTFAQTERWDLKLTDSPIIAAHPQLRLRRELDDSDLDEFTISERLLNTEPLSVRNDLVAAANATVDPRYERIALQQFVQFSVVRRDVTFRMCGSEGILVLSGKALTPGMTPEAVRPIKLRTRYLALAFLAVVGTALGVWSTLAGRTSYFANVNLFAVFAIAGGGILAIPSLAGFFRAWGAPLARTTLWEKLLGAASLSAITAAFLVTVLERPTIAEVDAAIASGNVDHAYHVLSALHDVESDSLDVRAAEGRVRVADAKRSFGQKRLALLDQAAAGGGGAVATEAAAAARVERLSQIRASIAAGRTDEAIKSIETWFPRTNDAEVLEELARAHEAAFAKCGDKACRLARAEQASRVKSSGPRTEAVSAARKELLDALTIPTPSKDVVTRLKEARALDVLATSVRNVGVSSSDVLASADVASKWSAERRLEVPLIGAKQDVAEELLEKHVDVNERIGLAHLEEGVDAYMQFDAAGRIRGLYVVGATAKARAIDSTSWSADRILSQAIGSAANVHLAVNGANARWYEGSVPVHARYRDSNLVELRVGNATP